MGGFPPRPAGAGDAGLERCVCGGGEDGNRGARKEAFGEKQDEGRVAEEDLGPRCGGETDVGVGWATGREEKPCVGGASSVWASPFLLPT